MAFTDIIDKFFIGYESDVYNVLLYTLGAIIYAIIIWKFYTNLSKRDLIKFNLYEFDFSSAGGKFFHLISYFIKYLILTPILTCIWFLMLLLVLFLLAKSQTVYNLLLTSFTLIGAVRAASYYNERLSEDLAKVVPFTLLAIFVIDPAIFTFDVITNRINELPNFLPLILRFLVVVVVLEFILRFLYEIKELVTGDSEG